MGNSQKLKNTYVVAVSGGVDSVVLLDMLVNHNEPDSQNFDPEALFIVAHFDHGIRSDSEQDAMLVEQLAKKYDLLFEGGVGNLTFDASELEAREARYRFLELVKKKYTATATIMAHHQDDLVETAIINIIRGTGWRGLVSLSSGEGTLRPLLHTSKQTLLEYAQEHRLVWHEDSTNQDQKYLRNYIRHTLLPKAESKDPKFKEKLLSFVLSTQKLIPEINQELQGYIQNITSELSDSGAHFLRYDFIMLPPNVAQEIIYKVLRNLDPAWHPSTLHIQRALHFIKSALPHKSLVISKHLKLMVTKESIQFIKY